MLINEPLELADWFISCVNGGAGEFVDFTGVFTGVLHFTISNERLQGEGASTGNQYRFRDMFASSQSSSSFNEQLSFTSNFTTVITTAGPGNDILLRDTSHLTRDANGEIRVNLDNISFDECK